MKQVELLAPAGSFEALQAAVQNGCDAVYLGGTQFGARAFAHNFDHAQMKEAIAYAHTYGVRVYVTVNTLIYDAEFPDIMRYIEQLQEQDVDALIIQDLGLFHLVHLRFPDLELHASTQMHIHNPQGISLLRDMGASRVVLPRETTIEEIRSYATSDMELEVFVQGALCVSYSGQCLMSAWTQGRSGNRGECAQSCRMQYTLENYQNGKYSEISSKGNYLLSPKDLNTLAMVPCLMDAGIASFKIEGRMKRPEYVALMTSLYRQAIDAHQQGMVFEVKQAMQEAMEKVFHRGFTKGHLFHERGSALMNPLRPNHMGISAGVVEQVTRDRMTIHLTSALHQGDGVRILKQGEDEGFCVNRMYQNGLLVNGAHKGEHIQLDKKGYVEKGSVLLKTSDRVQLEELRKSYTQPHRRVDVHMRFHMKNDQPARLQVQDDDGYCVDVQSQQPCERALKTPLSKDRIQAQLRKCNDTPYTVSEIVMDTDENGTLPIKELNRMRREALETMTSLRQQRHAERRNIHVTPQRRQLPTIAKTLIVVHTEEQLKACMTLGYNDVYIADTTLYHNMKELYPTIRLREDRVKKTAYDHEACTLIQEAGGLQQGHEVYTDTSLNVTNAHTADVLFQQGASIVTASLEHDEASLSAMLRQYHQDYGEGNFAVQLYGHVTLMLSEYCPIQTCIKGNGKKHCGLCRGTSRYDLRDKKGHRYPILTDSHCRIQLLSEEPIQAFSRWADYQAMGVTSALLVFTIEDAQQTRAVLNRFKEACA